MVIDYSVTGPWVKGISLPESEDEFIFAFYMPTTTKILKNDLPAPEFAGMNLGEYLRACEASDHMGWDDPAKMQIVTRIQKNTVTQIENKIEMCIRDSWWTVPGHHVVVPVQITDGHQRKRWAAIRLRGPIYLLAFIREGVEVGDGGFWFEMCIRDRWNIRCCGSLSY